MTKSISEGSYFASYRGITQEIYFKVDGKTIRAEVWDKNSGTLLATIDNLFIEALPSKTPQKTLSWMLKNHYSFTWSHSQSITYRPTLRGGNNSELLDQLDDPDLITALFNDPNQAQSYVEAIQEDPTLKNQLFDFVLASRTDSSKAVRAANSISLLNAARVPFSKMDLSGVNIPGAHLWGAILDRTIFDKAILTNAVLTNAFLRGCSFKGTDMRGVQFGEKAYLEHSEPVEAIAFSPDGKILATGCEKDIYLWKEMIDSKTGKKSFQLYSTLVGHKDAVLSLAFSPNGKILATGSEDCTVYLWEEVIDPTTENKTFQHFDTLDGYKSGVLTVAFSPNGKVLATKSRNDITLTWKEYSDDEGEFGQIGGEEIVHLWAETINPKTGKRVFQLVTTLEGHEDRYHTLVVFSPDGQILATGGYDREVCLWREIANPKIEKKTPQPFTTFKRTGWICSLAFSPSSKLVATGDTQGRVCLWEEAVDPKTGEVGFQFLTILGEDKNPIEILAFSPDGKLLAFGKRDTTVCLLEETIDPKTGKVDFLPLTTLKGDGDSVNILAFSPDGNLLASGSSDSNIVHLWDGMKALEIREKIFRPLSNSEKESRDTRTVAFSPDGKLLASGNFDGTVSLWEKEIDPITGKQIFRFLATLEGYKHPVTTLAFSPKGEILAIGSNQVIYLHKKMIDPTTKKKIFQLFTTLEGHKNWVLTSVFSPDGKILAIEGGDNKIHLWEEVVDTITRKKIFQYSSTLEGHKSEVLTLAFFPNGKILAIGSLNSTIRLWEETTDPTTKKKSFQLFTTLEGQDDFITALAFSNQQKILAVGTDNGIIYLWREVIDPKTGKRGFQPLSTLEGLADLIWTLAFSPDGKTLMVGCDDRTLKSWELFNDKGEFDPHLTWISTPNSLFGKGAQIDGVQGLSPENYALLLQRGILTPSIPRTLEDSDLTPSSEEVSGKRSVLEESHQTLILVELQEAIQGLLDWLDQQFPDRNFDSEPPNVKDYLQNLLAYVGKCRRSPPKEEEELKQVVQFFRDQLRDFQTYYGGNKSSLQLFPIPKTEPSRLERMIEKKLKEQISEREKTNKEELQKIRDTLTELKKAKKDPSNANALIDKELTSLKAKLQSTQKILGNLQIWKEEQKSNFDDLLKEQQKSSKELQKLEEDANVKEKALILKKRQEHEELEKRIKDQQELQKLLEGQCALYSQEIKKLQDQQKILEDKHIKQKDKLEPIYKEYRKKKKLLKDQQQLTSSEETRIFYNALENGLGIKFQSALLLTGDLLQRSAVKKDYLVDVAGFTVDAVFGFVAGAISIGTFGASTVIVGLGAAAASAVVGKAVEEFVASKIDKKYENRAQEIGAALENPDHAWDVAELVSRRISLRYFKELKKNAPTENKEWATKAFDVLYNFIASGNLKEKSFATEDEMIDELVVVLEQHIEAEKKKKGSGLKKKCEIL